MPFLVHAGYEDPSACGRTRLLKAGKYTLAEPQLNRERGVLSAIVVIASNLALHGVQTHSELPPVGFRQPNTYGSMMALRGTHVSR